MQTEPRPHCHAYNLTNKGDDMEHTTKEKAGMLIATASMIGIETKYDFTEVIAYIYANVGDYFKAPNQPTKANKEQL